MLRRAAFALFLVCLAATHALAWGNSGHRITARLAQARLSDAAEQEVREILGARFISDFASAPDDWRNNDGARITAGWHFVNTAIADDTYDAARDCPGGQCVVAQIEAMRAVLADRSQSQAARREALIYIIHFVGDLHQPFHTGSGTVDGQPDRGGNRINVNFDGQQRNLHAVWDSGLIERRHLNVADYVQHLEDDVLPGLNADEVSGGTPVDWVNESHQIAQDERVENNTRLSSDYIENAMTIVDQRLARGGLRLAKFIEDALAEN